MTEKKIPKDELKRMVKRAIYESIETEDGNDEIMAIYMKKLFTVNKIVQKLIDDHYDPQ